MRPLIATGLRPGKTLNSTAPRGTTLQWLAKCPKTCVLLFICYCWDYIERNALQLEVFEAGLIGSTFSVLAQALFLSTR
eukprot:5738016-Amphidinium_carterae.1